MILVKQPDGNESDWLLSFKYDEFTGTMNLQAQLLTNENDVWIADAVLFGQRLPV